MSQSNDNDDIEFRHHDELFFRPLSIKQCWSVAYDLVVRKHFALFFKLGLSAVLPVAFLVLWIPSYRYDRMVTEIVEVLLCSLSVTVANGPVMVATAELYAGHKRQRETHRNDDGDNLDDDSWWWYECYAVFVRQDATNHRPSAASRKRKILGNTMAGGFFAIAMVSFASILLYVPGIYLAVRWYFVPCILLFDQTSMRESFRRSCESTSSPSQPKPQEQGSRTIPAGRKRGCLGIKFELFCILFRLFLLEFLPMVLIVLASDILHQLTWGHLIFGHKVVADFFGFTLYAIGTIAHKCLFVPFSIVLKTIVYLNLRIANENLTGTDFRSLLRENGLELERFSGGSGGDSDVDNELQTSLLAANGAVELRERKSSSYV